MESHDLHHEFPPYAERVHHPKMSDGHFRRLFDEYHEVQKEIHRVEQSGIFTDEELNRLRHRRSHLKDELFHRLTAWAVAPYFCDHENHLYWSQLCRARARIEQ